MPQKITIDSTCFRMYRNCRVCGVSDTERPIYPNLDYVCSSCFAWEYNCRKILENLKIKDK